MSRRFLRAERASVALESALALSILVGAFAGLVHIVGEVFADDRMGRGARAVARVLAIDPGTDPWAVLAREVGDGALSGCPDWPSTGTAAGVCAGWTLAVTRGWGPRGLDAAHRMLGEVAGFARGQGSTVGGSGAAGGELVLAVVERAADAGATVSAFGLARSEPER